MTPGRMTLLARLILARSPYAIAARAIGFTFGDVEVLPAVALDGHMLRFTFTCVCGKTEYANFAVTSYELTAARDPSAMLDGARLLYAHGSFSERHLLADGYPPEVAADIADRYKCELDAARAYRRAA